MREIKYRVRLQDLNDESNTYTQFYRLDDLLNGWNPSTLWKIISRDEWTGLQDKNGKEIYEGDIVNLDGYDSHGDFGEYKVEFSGTFKVIWHNEIASFDLQRINATVDGWMLSHDSKDDLEVIGNIYECPHLLDKTI